MNKPKDDSSASDAAFDAAATPTTAAPQRSAMKLPANAGPKGSQGPRQHRPWEGGGGIKPQSDAERRAGKSRKVH